MKKSLLFLPLLAFTSLASLTGCSDGKTHVKFWHTMGKDKMDLLDRMIEEFNKIYPDVKIDHGNQGDYTALYEKLTQSIPAGKMPQMAFCYPDHVADYNVNNAVINVEDYLARPELAFTAEEGSVEDFVETYWQEGKEYSKAGTYSVPFAKSTEVLFYNKTFFDTYHLTVPTTWDEMWAVCEQIKVLNQTNNLGLEYPLGYDSDSNLFITLCEQRCIPYTTNKNITKLEDHVQFNNTQARALIEELKAKIDAGLFITKGCLPEKAYTSTKFTEGSIVMSVGSTGGTSYNTTTNFEVAVAPAPVTKAGDKFISQGPSVCFFKKGTDAEKEAAWNFYKFITKSYYSAAYGTLSGYEPVRKSSYQLDSYTDYLAGGSLQAKTSKVTATLEGRYYNSAVFPGSAKSREEVGNILANVVKGTKTLEKAFADAYVNATGALQ